MRSDAEMKVKESILIDSSVDEVWEILKDPGNMPAWNYKCCDCKADSNIVIGSTFEATFKMSKTKNVASCEVIELKSCNAITIRYSGESFGSTGGYVDESFILTCIDPRQTKLDLVVDFTNSKLPLILKCIMWFIHTFGYSAGRSSLDGIKDLL